MKKKKQQQKKTSSSPPPPLWPFSYVLYFPGQAEIRPEKGMRKPVTP